MVTKGDTITLDEGCPDAFAWFPLPLVSSVVQSSNVMATSKFLADFDANAVQTAIDHKFFHVAFTGPVGYNGMDVLMEDTDVSGNAYALGGESNTIIPAPPSPSAAPSTIKVRYVSFEYNVLDFIFHLAFCCPLGYSLVCSHLRQLSLQYHHWSPCEILLWRYCDGCGA